MTRSSACSSPLLTIALAVLGSCRSGATSLEDELATRLAALGTTRFEGTDQERTERLKRLVERSRVFGMTAQPDAHGTVAVVLGDRAAVKLDVDSSPIPEDEPVGMAIFSGQTYKAELVVHETYRGHAMGRIMLKKLEPQVGDRASCRVP